MKIYGAITLRQPRIALRAIFVTYKYPNVIASNSIRCNVDKELFFHL